MIMFDPPHPGEILREDYLSALDMSITQLAKSIGVSRKNLSEILNEKTGISAEMAIRLSKAFNTTPELWLGMQKEYELARAMKKGIQVEQLV
ncbi:MAG: HigA family addiction module antitoxin [Cyclobacteriaceae bacterium]